MQPHQLAVIVPGAFGSTSGPRGGALRWNVTSDPFSCSNIGGLLVDFNGDLGDSLHQPGQVSTKVFPQHLNALSGSGLVLSE